MFSPQLWGPGSQSSMDRARLLSEGSRGGASLTSPSFWLPASLGVALLVVASHFSLYLHHHRYILPGCLCLFMGLIRTLVIRLNRNRNVAQLCPILY